MLSVLEYFERYLGYKMSMISSDNLNLHGGYYETYRNLDDSLLILHAEQENNPGALEELGERSYFMKKDTDSAVKYLEKASGMGNGEAGVLLAQIYRNDYKNWNKYFECLALAADQGNTVALFNLACCYYKGKAAYEGNGFDQNKEMSLQLSEAASKRAMELLTVFFTRPCSRAFSEYIRQQVSIFVQSTVTASDQLIKGDGVPQDLLRAKELLNGALEFSMKYFREDIGDFASEIDKINKA